MPEAKHGRDFIIGVDLGQARELRKVGLVSKHRSVTYERAGEVIDQLKLDIAELMDRAEAADGGGEEDPQALPKEIARREALRDRLDAARRRLEAQAKARRGRAGGLRGQGCGARDAPGPGQGQAPEAAR